MNTSHDEILSKLRAGLCEVVIGGFTISGATSFSTKKMIKGLAGVDDIHTKYRMMVCYFLLVRENPCKKSLLSQDKMVISMLKWMDTIKANIGDEELRERIKHGAFATELSVLSAITLYSWRSKCNIEKNLIDLCVKWCPEMQIKDNKFKIREDELLRKKLEEMKMEEEEEMLPPNISTSEYKAMSKTSAGRIEAHLERSILQVMAEIKEKRYNSTKFENFVAEEWKGAYMLHRYNMNEIEKLQELKRIGKHLSNIVRFFPSTISSAWILKSFLDFFLQS